MTQFESNRSSSNECGVTLMNNQVGYVVAKVMDGKKDVTMRELPSMIRVDGIGTIEFNFEEIAEALGWEDFGNDDFEEIMSTHYGRMVVLDDRVLMFANPEDAAEYIGFDLQPVGRADRMYEKDGEKYFVLDTHLHFWDASPENWVKGAEQYAKGWIECFHAYQGLGPAGDALVDRALPEVLRGGLREGRLHRRLRRRRDLPADVPARVVHGGLQRPRAQRRAAGALPGQVHRQRALGPARGRGRAWRSSRPTTSASASRA